MTTTHTHATRIKTNVAAISIFASAGMAAAKFAVGIAIGSLALAWLPDCKKHFDTSGKSPAQFYHRANPALFEMQRRVTLR